MNIFHLSIYRQARDLLNSIAGSDVCIPINISLTIPEVMIDFYLKLVSKEVIKFISTLTHIIYQSIDRPRMY